MFCSCPACLWARSVRLVQERLGQVHASLRLQIPGLPLRHEALLLQSVERLSSSRRAYSLLWPTVRVCHDVPIAAEQGGQPVRDQRRAHLDYHRCSPAVPSTSTCFPFCSIIMVCCAASMCLPFAFIRDFPVDCGDTVHIPQCCILPWQSILI